MGHQKDYKDAIAQWEGVLAWSNKHGDTTYVSEAGRKLAGLRRRLAEPTLTPLACEDLFEANFSTKIDLPKRESSTDVNLLGETSQITRDLAKFRIVQNSNLTSEDLSPLWTITPQNVERDIWRDRLEVMERKVISEDKTLEGLIKKFVEQKKNQAVAEHVTVGRVYALKLHLEYFQDWLGKDTAVTEIGGETLSRFHAHVLSKVSPTNWTRVTAGHYMTTVKSFVRWLYEIEAIPALPRIMEGRSQALTITRPAPQIVTFTKEEINFLLEAASDRTKLYILLMLNCGMTQKDVSDLLVSEVYWLEGRIVRKRSKTSDFLNVPTVNYMLWRETFRLLKQERTADSEDRVLLNSNGKPLWIELFNENGKYQKNDNIKSAFNRLRLVTKIDKSLRSLKKTSATLLRDSGTFSGLQGLFLDLAPQSIADKHYAGVPQDLLDQAVTWLGREYGIM